MNEIILTLVLVSPTGVQFPVQHYDEQHMTCEEAGEQYLGQWVNTNTNKYMVSGYVCDSGAEVNSTIRPFNSTNQED